MFNKDVAKVLIGVAGIEIINHSVLAFCNLPFHCFGIMISGATNTIILIGWVIVFVASVYSAWFKK